MEVESTYFKIYLRDSNHGESEIRRFKVNKFGEKKYCFADFCKDVKELFPKLQNKDFTVYCKDDGDDITISSDQEFKIAMQLMFTNIKVFYVKVLSQEQERQKPTKEDVVHIRITCDGCNAHNITGFRYKCIECEDYDLCSKCEAKGEHPYHHMIRMPQPFMGHRNKSFFHHLRKGLKKNNPYASRKHGSCEYAFQGLSPWIESSVPFLNDFITTLLFEKDSHEEPNSTETHKADKKNEPVDIDMHVDENASRKFPGEGRKLLDDAIGNVRSDAVTSSRRESFAASTSSQESSSAKVAATDEWTILDKNDSAEVNQASPISTNTPSSAAPSAPKETSATQTIYPELPKEKITYHPDPIINEAVETMIGMGFSNQGGLLTYVVAAEKGDIDKVLEILQSAHK
ncbi:unnamed protein product [Xylocopa violacea]|uniref:ZZ-type domain-containing protein n=1 Tax=Xylocopa violacea TaxID=135666 RepID=A0ABP1N6Y4_XYLVO